ncbi:ribonuclease P protein component [Aquaticitalea lipolytica]|uniref:Ribonuclease P protein component n=1 Tax=Aquaticitalea lipolytica TaxID=1247562 RepID=A0A8J2XGS1_9FLAO|nr:ribonuclease P protein component [Aquaticitalea lipolytica]GFZ90040.1 ribonuclease P protein component [Aquaticitalea lipolytica]
MKLTFNKTEKLKSQKLIEKLFLEGKSVVSYPLRLVFIETTFDDNVKIKAGVSVSKRHFKNAVDRNRIKRLMREAYRLNKANYFNNITTQYALMILYIGKDGTEFDAVNEKMNQLFEKFLKETSTED